MKTILHTLKFWLPLAAVVTILSALVYLTAQQSLRMNANDPQIQMAEDTARALASGQPAASLVPPTRVDIAQSLAPYLMVFDANGNLQASNAVLHGQTPSLPAGVFQNVRQHGEDRITWQPEPGVRSATVIAPIGDGSAGFVLAGRSLREVEKRIDQFTGLVAAAWLAALGVSLTLALLFELLPATKAL